MPSTFSFSILRRFLKSEVSGEATNPGQSFVSFAVTSSLRSSIFTEISFVAFPRRTFIVVVFPAGMPPISRISWSTDFMSCPFSPIIKSPGRIPPLYAGPSRNTWLASAPCCFLSIPSCSLYSSVVSTRLIPTQP